MTLRLVRAAILLPFVTPVALALALVAPPARSDVRTPRRAQVAMPALGVAAALPAAPALVGVQGGDELPHGVALDVVLSEANTRFATGGASADRAFNVRRAARLLDGAVIPPHGTLSFNGVVGPRTRRAGFHEAPVIVSGRITDGVGGGVCQVAGTLHTAALRAGLEIARKQSHSRPSTYLPPGFDAMVAWPESDLVLENPYAFAVLVDVELTGPVLHVTLRGDDGAVPATVTSTIEEELPARELIVEDPTLVPGQSLVDYEAVDGRVVRVTRTRGERSDSWVVRYPAHARVVRVGPAIEGSVVAAL